MRRGRSRELEKNCDHGHTPSVTFPESDLLHAGEHLAFDVFYFRLYADRYRTYRSDMQYKESHQAVLYALLLHFRLLLHFFYGKPQHDDCCAEHFRSLPGFEAGFPPEIHTVPPWEGEVRRHLNKRLAHFAATRWKTPRPDMDYYA